MHQMQPSILAADGDIAAVGGDQDVADAAVRIKSPLEKFGFVGMLARLGLVDETGFFGQFREMT